MPTQETTKGGLVDKIPEIDLNPHNNIQFITVCILICVVSFFVYSYFAKKPIKKTSEDSSNLYFSSERKIKMMVDSLGDLEREIINLKHENRMKSELIEVLIKKLDGLYNIASEGLEVREAIITTNLENKESVLALGKKFDDLKVMLLGRI